MNKPSKSKKKQQPKSFKNVSYVYCNEPADIESEAESSVIQQMSGIDSISGIFAHCARVTSDCHDHCNK